MAQDSQFSPDEQSDATGGASGDGAPKGASPASSAPKGDEAKDIASGSVASGDVASSDVASDSAAPNGETDGEAAEGKIWSVVVPGTADALPHVREMVIQAATRCGFGDEEIAKIEMAVDEACTNIIEHAYKTLQEENSSGHLEIEVYAHEHPDRLEITILDRSLDDFPVDQLTPEDAENYFAEHKRRGLGLFIIRSFVDDVKHRFIDGKGNELLLIKYFI